MATLAQSIVNAVDSGAGSVAGAECQASLSARLGAILANSGDAIATYGVDGRIVDWNGAAERMFGFLATELEGHAPAVLVPADRRDEPEQMLQRVLRGERIVDFETIRLHKSGVSIHISLSVSPIIDERGQIVGVCKIAHDVGDRIQAQAILKASEERFRAFMDNSPSVAFMKDREGRLVYISGEYIRRLVPSGQDWLGKTNRQLLAPEVAAVLETDDQIVLRSGRAAEFIESVPDRNGRMTHLLVHKFPFRDHTGEEFLAGQAVDVTDRIQAERAMAESRQRLKSALAASHTGTYFRSLRDDFLDADDEMHRLYGCPDRLKSLADWMALIHDEDRASVAEKQAICMRTGKTFDADFRVKLPNGAVRWLHSKGEFFFDQHGKPDHIYGACVDITARKLSEKALAESERFATSIVDALTAHIAILDETGQILSVNRAWRQFAADNGADPNDVGVGTNYLATCESIYGSDSADAHAAAEGILGVIKGDQAHFALEYRCDSPVEKRWFVLHVSRFAGDGPVRVVVAHENVTARRLAEERLRHDSMHDALTGLPNRVLLTDRIGRSLERSRGRSGYHAALLLIDLDRFKIVNDSLGLMVGDKVLMTAAARLGDCISAIHNADRDETCTLARFGGDEFVVWVEGLRRPDDVVQIAQRLLKEISLPLNLDGQEIISTASVGIASASTGPEAAAPVSARDLIRDADMAMNCAKSRGRNQYALFDANLHSTALTRLRLEGDLRHAMERRELLLYYQPIVSLKNRELEGFEALLRWRRNGEIVSPADFIPIAEETGLIVAIGQWVMTESCRQLALWRDEHPELPGLYMSINVSRKQLSDPGLAGNLIEALRETRVGASHVRLEITESVIMESDAAARQMLGTLKQTGALLSMDDFGTGYSSLSCLGQFPIDVLKIDRAFLTDLAAQGDAAAILSAIVKLAHDLEITVVAEGLESAEQVAFLESLGCDNGQGYLFSKPMPADQAAQYIEKQPTRVAAA